MECAARRSRCLCNYCAVESNYARGMAPLAVPHVRSTDCSAIRTACAFCRAALCSSPINSTTCDAAACASQSGSHDCTGYLTDDE
jgi:hypothetical protein